MVKKNILTGILLLATLLTTWHFYTAHYLKGVYPPELILSITIMAIVTIGVYSKLLLIKNV